MALILSSKHTDRKITQIQNQNTTAYNNQILNTEKEEKIIIDRKIDWNAILNRCDYIDECFIW